MDKKESTKEAKEQAKADEKERLIQVAVQFLMNPKMEALPHDKKMNFLKKKGLNDKDLEQVIKIFNEKKAEKQAKEETGATENAGNGSFLQKQSQAPTAPSETLEEKLEKARQSGFLSLKGTNISQLPPDVFKIENLKVLILSGNKIQNIPAEIANLKNLQTLHAIGCALNENQIDEAFGKLQQLTELNLSQNHITSIDKFMFLRNLKKLDVSNNEIMDIPGEIESLQKLEMLNLRKNNISFLASSLGNLPNLKQLIITENNIEKHVEDIYKTSGVKGLLAHLKSTN